MVENILSLSESDLEEILVKYPILIDEGLTLLGRQVTVGRLRVDLIFRDKFGDTLIVELKKGTIKRNHVGQIMEYSGSLYEKKPVRLMLIGNRIPPSFQRSLEYHGIEWRELSEEKILLFLEAKDKSLLKRLQAGKTTIIPNRLPIIVNKGKPVSKLDLDKTFQAFTAKKKITNTPQKNVTAEQHLNKIENKKLKDMATELREAIKDNLRDIVEKSIHKAIIFRTTVDIIGITTRKNFFWLNVKMPKDEVNRNEFELSKNKNPVWTHIRVKENTNFNSLVEVVIDAYNRNL